MLLQVPHQRLDKEVYVSNFGAAHDATTIQTAALQREMKKKTTFNIGTIKANKNKAN